MSAAGCKENVVALVEAVVERILRALVELPTGIFSHILLACCIEAMFCGDPTEDSVREVREY